MVPQGGIPSSFQIETNLLAHYSLQFAVIAISEHLQTPMVLQPPSQEANRKWILSVKVMAKHSIQRIQPS
jgi:hypothetical protein